MNTEAIQWSTLVVILPVSHGYRRGTSVLWEALLIYLSISFIEV